jgi:hypothetical protein
MCKRLFQYGILIIQIASSREVVLSRSLTATVRYIASNG